MEEHSCLAWAGTSGTQPGAGNGTCGSGTLSNSLSGAAYSTSYVSTHLGQLWQGPLNGGSTQYQYLYCGSQPHQLTGLYPLGTTCSSKSGQVYTSGYDAFGNVTTRSCSGTTFYLTDALGSVLASFNNVSSSAAVKGNQVFGPYGTARYFKGTINTAKGFDCCNCHRL